MYQICALNSNELKIKYQQSNTREAHLYQKRKIKKGKMCEKKARVLWGESYLLCAWTNFDFLASSSAENEVTGNKIQNKNQISGKKKKEDWGWEKRKMDLPVRPRENLVITAPVTANPTRKGQFRFHSRLKKTGQGSNRRIFSSLLFLFLSLSALPLQQHLIPAILFRYCLTLKPNGLC